MFEELKPHLIELKKRLFISVMTIFVLFFITFAFWKPIVIWMSQPLFEAINVEYSANATTEAKSFIEQLTTFEMPKELQNSQFMMSNDVFEVLFMAFKIAFFAAFILALPVIFWQLWLFVAPGLYDHEKKYVLPFVFFATLMFLLGAAFCYYIVLPMSFQFAIAFSKGLFVYIPKITEYVGTFVKIMIGFGISFEFPVISLFLAKLGWITDKTLKDFFRYAVVVIVIFAAIITPPDVLSQILMSIPLLLLYAISILLVKMINPYKPDEEEKAADESA